MWSMLILLLDYYTIITINIPAGPAFYVFVFSTFATFYETSVSVLCM